MIFMFNFFKKSKSKGNEVKAPIKGNLIPLSEVSDDVFSQKMLGDGFAVKPTGQEVVALVSGTIIPPCSRPSTLSASRRPKGWKS